MSKISILHILPSLEIGGMENALVNLLNGMDSTHFHSSIFCFNSENDAPPLKARIKDGDIPIYQYYKGERLDYWLPVRVSQILRKESIDIVHARNFAAILYGATGAKLAGVRAVVGDIRGPIPAEQGRKCRRLSFMLSRFIAVSNDVKRMLTYDFGIPSEKVRTIYNGVHLNGVTDRNSKEIARKKLGLNSNDVIIGTIGRLEPVKDYPSLIRACVPILKNNESVKLLIVGGGSQLEALKKIAVQQGVQNQCIFTDYQPDVTLYLAAFDVFVLTSVFEGISNVILEAMTHALPVVVTAVGGNPEVVADQESGFLVSKHDVAMLTEKINLLLNDRKLALKMGKAGYQIVKQKFTIPKMIDQYQKLYLELLSAH